MPCTRTLCQSTATLLGGCFFGKPFLPSFPFVKGSGLPGDGVPELALELVAQELLLPQSTPIPSSLCWLVFFLLARNHLLLLSSLCSAHLPLPVPSLKGQVSLTPHLWNLQEGHFPSAPFVQEHLSFLAPFGKEFPSSLPAPCGKEFPFSLAAPLGKGFPFSLAAPLGKEFPFSFAAPFVKEFPFSLAAPFGKEVPFPGLFPGWPNFHPPSYGWQLQLLQLPGQLSLLPAQQVCFLLGFASQSSTVPQGCQPVPFLGSSLDPCPSGMGGGATASWPPLVVPPTTLPVPIITIVPLHWGNFLSRYRLLTFWQGKVFFAQSLLSREAGSDFSRPPKGPLVEKKSAKKKPL